MNEFYTSNGTPEKEAPKPQENTSNASNFSSVPYYKLSQMNGCAQPSLQKPKPAYLGKDTLFAYLSILVGFLFVRVMPVTRTPLGGMLFVLLLFAFGGAYLYLSKVRLSAPVILFAVCGAVLSVGMITNGNLVLRGFLFAFLIFGFLYWIYAVCGLTGAQILDENCFLHAVNAVITLPCTSLYHLFPALPIRLKKGKNNGRIARGAAWALLGLAVAIIPTAIVVSLLSYDEQFTAILDKMFSFSLDGVWEYVRDVVLGFLVAIPLFGALFGVNWRRMNNNGEAEKVNNGNTHILPRPLAFAAVTPLLAVYVIFFISQWDYYLSAFTHTLPGDLTFAAYARNGFFELCWVSAINAVLLLLFNLLIRRTKGKNDPLRAVYSAIISLFTLILIATAISKMALYIDSYGLTQKRVYASWFMLLLAAVFILVLVKQFAAKLKLVRSIALCCVLFFALIALPNVDGMIASYNVNAYLSGDLGRVDVESLADYGVSAVPALIKLETELSEQADRTDKDDEILQHTANILDRIASNLKEAPNGFFRFSIPTSRANSLLRENGRLE